MSSNATERKQVYVHIAKILHYIFLTSIRWNNPKNFNYFSARSYARWIFVSLELFDRKKRKKKNLNHVAEEITIFDRYAVFFRILYTIVVYKILHHRLFGQVFSTSMGNDHKKEGVKLPTGKQNFTTERIFIANHQCNFSHLISYTTFKVFFFFFLFLLTDRSTKNKQHLSLILFALFYDYQGGFQGSYRFKIHSVVSKLVPSLMDIVSSFVVSFQASWCRSEIHIIKLIAVSSLIVSFQNS